MRQEETVKTVQRMQEYIEAHVCEEITLKKLAAWKSYRCLPSNSKRRKEHV